MVYFFKLYSLFITYIKTGDGKLDFVYVHTSAFVYINNGNRTFQQEVSLNDSIINSLLFFINPFIYYLIVDLFVQNVAVGDVNGDGISGTL